MKLYIFSLQGANGKTIKLTFDNVEQETIDYLNTEYRDFKKLGTESVEVGRIITLKPKQNEKFARKCDISGKGMNKGYCFNDGEFYCATEREAKQHVESLGLNWEEELKTVDTENEWFYWTEWEIEAGENWYNENGEEFEDNSLLLEEFEEGAQNRFRNNDYTSFEEWKERKKENLNH